MKIVLMICDSDGREIANLSFPGGTPIPDKFEVLSWEGGNEARVVEKREFIYAAAVIFVKLFTREYDPNWG